MAERFRVSRSCTFSAWSPREFESLLDESGKFANTVMAVFVAEDFLGLRGTNDNPQRILRHWRRRKGTGGRLFIIEALQVNKG